MQRIKTYHLENLKRKHMEQIESSFDILSRRFNDELFGRFVDLIVNSLMQMANHNFITQGFIRHILILMFSEEVEYRKLVGLKDKVQTVDKVLFN